MQHLRRSQRHEGLVVERDVRSVRERSMGRSSRVTSADDRREVDRARARRGAVGMTRRLSRMESTVWSMRSTWASASLLPVGGVRLLGGLDAWPPSSST